MTVESSVGEPLDQFPVGMRVLAVDDDPTCLKLLETLLRRCQYHVTTTNQAITALKMLRENRDRFDLVISDVRMPDMDGFKLLELVGLEMDLPVIMLSAYGDPKLVMKGIKHGACDYLLKPIRIEELKNIWQHVIRKRKVEGKKPNADSENKDGSAAGTNDASGTVNVDQNSGTLNKKRKDQEENEEEDGDEDAFENDDPSAQKKPRVVWSFELHQKFVAAVNYLGIDKAVPKKILDVMNVEKLTRENVASHLQKYRLYLKRISCVTNQHTNMTAFIGSRDRYFQMGSSLNGPGHGFQQPIAVGSGHYPGSGNPALRSFPPNRMLTRLNSSSGLGVHGLTTAGVFPQNPVDSKFQQGPANVLQGTPMFLELDQLPGNNNDVLVNSTAGFCVQNTRVGVPNNLLALEGHPQQDLKAGGVFGNQSSQMNSAMNSGLPSQFPADLSTRRLNDWSGAVSSTANSIDGLAMTNNQFDSPFLSAVPPAVPPVQLHQSKRESQDWSIHNNSVSYPLPCRSVDFNTMWRSSFVDPSWMKQNEFSGYAMGAPLSNTDGGNLMDPQKLQNGCIDAGSLDDIVNSMVKQEQFLIDVSEGDFGFNGLNPVRTCM